uniref:BTB domain-containing protein n=1 Tax=Magallana gigas TaxID=29159 RepID=A0A8W8IHQ3_MAGGI|nr:serine-enriched protein [Crassostrea gigas]
MEMTDFGSTTCLLGSNRGGERETTPEGFSSGYDSNSDTNLERNRLNNFLQWSPWRSNDDSDSDSEISDVDSCISESESEDEEGAWKQRGAWLNEEAWSDSSDSESEDDADSVKYVNAEAVSEALTVVMDMPDLCDVTFLVGSTLTPVHGVKSIMSTRSRVFYQLILKAVKESSHSSKKKKSSKKHIGQTPKPTVHIPEVSVSIFKKLVHYIHTGRVDIKPYELTELMCAAHRYDLPDLMEICRKFLDSCTSTCAIYTVLDTAQRLQGQTIAQKIAQKMSERLTRLESRKKQMFNHENFV